MNIQCSLNGIIARSLGKIPVELKGQISFGVLLFNAGTVTAKTFCSVKVLLSSLDDRDPPAAMVEQMLHHLKCPAEVVDVHRIEQIVFDIAIQENHGQRLRQIFFE